MVAEMSAIEPGAERNRPNSSPSAIVGIGASAGGLKALQRFVDSVPADSGFAYVVIMHLDPERESRIAELLQDRAAVPVMQVTEETLVEANHIYVIPPDQDLAMDDRVIRVRDRGSRIQHTPVDLFLTTLAEVYGPDAIGVVLSGTGSDGTSGVRSIKEHGGITVAQAPDEADYGGMPASAIATGQVDRASNPAVRAPCYKRYQPTMPSRPTQAAKLPRAQGRKISQ